MVKQVIEKQKRYSEMSTKTFLKRSQWWLLNAYAVGLLSPITNAGVLVLIVDTLMTLDKLRITQLG